MRCRGAAAAAWAAEGRVAVHPKDVGRVADEEEGLVPKNLLVEGEEEEDVEGEVAQHRELGDREVCVLRFFVGTLEGWRHLDGDEERRRTSDSAPDRTEAFR